MAGTKAIDKALIVLKHILMSEEELRIVPLTEELGISQATLYRHIDALCRQGLIRRRGKSAYSAGFFLLTKYNKEEFHRRLADASRPIITALTLSMGLTTHLGVYDQDMVTYLVKSPAEGQELFTREATQLDAYCSGLGKVLLGTLSERELNSYFSAGQLPAITAKTFTDEDSIRQDIKAARERGYALDNEEFEENLFCIAVPVKDRDSTVIAALSASSGNPEHIGRQLESNVEALKKASDTITENLYL